MTHEIGLEWSETSIGEVSFWIRGQFAKIGPQFAESYNLILAQSDKYSYIRDSYI